MTNLTTEEAATVLGIGARTVRLHIKHGNLTAEKHGRDHLISSSELARFQEERRTVGRPKGAKNKKSPKTDTQTS